MKWKWLLMKINLFAAQFLKKQNFWKDFSCDQCDQIFDKGRLTFKTSMGRYIIIAAISLKHHEMRKHDNAMLGHPDMFWFDTRGVTHGDTWSSGTRSCQWGDSAGTPRHMLPWNYKSKHQFGTFLITTKKLKMYFFSYPVH